jgi:hypothetical protein
VGRLENIAERNKHPWKLKGTLSFGIRSVFLLVILGMLIFTDCGRAPKDDRPGINVVPAKQPGVNDVKLWTPPKRPPPAK